MAEHYGQHYQGCISCYAYNDSLKGSTMEFCDACSDCERILCECPDYVDETDMAYPPNYGQPLDD